MFVFKKNQIIITVLVFMIAIAAYLNWKVPSDMITPAVVDITDTGDTVADKDFFDQFQDKNAIDTLPPDEITVAATADAAVATDAVGTDAVATDAAVPTDATIVKDDMATQQMVQAVITKKSAANLEDASVAANNTITVSYFVEEKMLREQSRAAQVEQLNQAVDNENLDKESKAKAAESLLNITQKIEKESSAESLLRAKGFKDVFVRMDEQTVDVVVNKADLSDEEIAQIEEIVHRKTGYAIGQIKITPLNTTTESK